MGEPLGWASPLVDAAGTTWICAYGGGIVRVDCGAAGVGAPFFRSPQRGARSLVWLAISNAASSLTGEYVVDEKVQAPSGQAQDDRLAEALWERSEELVGLSTGTPA